MERILLIEDVGIFERYIVDTSLKTYKVDVAHNVGEARELLDKRKYSLVISDLGDTFDRRSKIMELTATNCSIPLIILNEAPQDLSFCDKLATVYVAVQNRFERDINKICMGKVSDVRTAIRQVKDQIMIKY